MRIVQLASGLQLGRQEWDTPDGDRTVSLGWESDPGYGPYHVEVYYLSGVVANDIPGTRKRFSKLAPAIEVYKQYNKELETSGATKAGEEYWEADTISKSLAEEAGRQPQQVDPNKVVIVTETGQYIGRRGTPVDDLRDAAVYDRAADNVDSQLEAVKSQYGKTWLAVPYNPALELEDVQPEI